MPHPDPQRRPMVVANWKMHKLPAEAAAFVERLRQSWRPHGDCVAVIAPPFPALAVVVAAAAGLDLAIGAQDLYWETAGAFTGEVSGPMLVAAGCRYVIVGHSERRQYFGETDATVNRKLRAALAAGLVPIVCVGEREEQRASGVTESVLAEQLHGACAGLSRADLANCVFAYEPVWAIGTGKTATPEIAQSAHAFIRGQIAAQFGAPAAAALTILYGGSISAANFASLLAQPDVDGGLVGSASLDPDTFATLLSLAA